MFAKRNTVLEIPADASAAAGGEALGYGGFWARLAALIVDNAILTILGFALVIGASFAGEAAAGIATAVYFLALLLYWPVMECSARQATFGKQLLGLQVTDAAGERLSFVRSLLRNLAKIISAIPLYIGFLLAAFTSRKQALHDIITNCLVVRAGPSHFLKAVVATVGGLILTIAAGYYYLFNVYFPQQMAATQKEMKSAQKGPPGMKPAPARPLVEQVQAPAPVAPSVAQPAPAPAPAKPATVEIKPAPPKPAAAPAAAAPAKPAAAPPVKVAAAPVVKEAPPAMKVKPAPKPELVISAVPSADEKPIAPRRAAAPAAPRQEAPAVTASRAPAAATGPSPRYNDIMTAVMYRDRAEAAQLLDLGWWPDRPDSNGVTPLMAAAWNGDAAMTELLLNRGANPHRRGPGGSVLQYAARGGDAKVYELLRQAGAR